MAPVQYPRYCMGSGLLTKILNKSNIFLSSNFKGEFIIILFYFIKARRFSTSKEKQHSNCTLMDIYSVKNLANKREPKRKSKTNPWLRLI